MLSIDGVTFSEVFTNLSNHRDLDESERAAARKIAEYFTARDERNHRYRLLREDCNQGRISYPEYLEARAEMDRRERIETAPYSGCPGLPSDMNAFEIDDVIFVVRPYTAGRTMNVTVRKV